MSLLKMYQPQLMTSPEGILVMKITLGGTDHYRKIDMDRIQDASPQQLEEYFGQIVPSMLEELRSLRRNKLKKERRKENGKASKTRSKHSSRRNPAKLKRAETAPDGDAGI